MTSDTETFGRRVLEMMESKEDWDADMLDQFSELAQRLGLAELDGAGYFECTIPIEKQVAPPPSGCDFRGGHAVGEQP